MENKIQGGQSLELKFVDKTRIYLNFWIQFTEMMFAVKLKMEKYINLFIRLKRLKKMN